LPPAADRPVQNSIDKFFASFLQHTIVSTSSQLSGQGLSTNDSKLVMISDLLTMANSHNSPD
jgi:hypothetical protein